MPVVVLLDTNVWVSAFINPSGTPAKLRQAWYESKFDVAISLSLLEELADVLTRPRITNKYPVNAADVEELFQLLIQRGISVFPTGSVKECRDPDDDLILETAILSKAKYAVTRDDDITRDQDLIAHLQTHGITVLTVQKFWEKVEKNDL